MTTGLASSNTYALGVEYDGGQFHGWQRQPEVPSVQGTLEQAVGAVLNQPAHLVAAGRTDTGVHATAQVASFSTDVIRPDRAYMNGVNAHLPDSVRVVWTRRMAADFHARFSATHRRYMFLFAEAPVAVLSAGQVWAGPALNVQRMHAAAQHLVGEQDFSAVRAAGCQSPTAIRCVHKISVRRFGTLVVLDVQANAFLLHMVRNIASALRQVGLGERSPDWLHGLLAGQDRSALGITAPPQGLYFVGVGYPERWELPGPRLPALLRTLGEFQQLC